LIWDFDEWSYRKRKMVNEALVQRFSNRWPSKMSEACGYPFRTGGKRIRPLIVFAAAEAIGDSNPSSTLAAAQSIELIHTYSLVHDDLPCMDDDEERRGKATTHMVYGEGPAVLVGDALLTEAFVAIAGLPAQTVASMLPILSRNAGLDGMIGGQALDIGMEGPILDENNLVMLHRCKTGALIRAAAQLGGVAAGATPEQRDLLKRYGETIGLAFQLVDDLLDEEEDDYEDGPPSFVKLLGSAETSKRAKELSKEATRLARNFPSPSALEAIARYTVARDH
jgi:geranylgeranyl pyrophosphate synthase